VLLWVRRDTHETPLLLLLLLYPASQLSEVLLQLRQLHAMWQLLLLLLLPPLLGHQTPHIAYHCRYRERCS
jgi:predicted Na+-dependent transporter